MMEFKQNHVYTTKNMHYNEIGRSTCENVDQSYQPNAEQRQYCNTKPAQPRDYLVAHSTHPST